VITTAERADRLLEQLGFAQFRPGQREAVEAALGGRDSLVVMPTGGGKSLCYQLPGLDGEDLSIVVSPLIALINDQCRRLSTAGHPVAMISSGMGEDAVRDSLAQVRSGRARIVYCSPERFGSGVFLQALGRRRIDLLAIDEAHCVSEWGHDFRPDYLRLAEIAERLGRPTLMACTATATEEVAAEIAARFAMRDPLQIRSGFDRPNISFDVIRLQGTGSKARRLALAERGLTDPKNRPAIVYCGTRRDTDAVAGSLAGSGLDALAYHAGMRPDQRTETQERFMSGAVDVIVATNAFGMGIDKADVRSVWHLTIPTSVEAYYQEAGRAGRDGLPARAIVLAMRSDLGRLVRFNQQRGADPELSIACQRGWRAYRAIESFIYSRRCRRRRLLEHFADREAPRALGRCCDVCDPVSWLDPETITQRGSRAGAAARHNTQAERLSVADNAVLEALRAWRAAACAGKPAYTVAHNRTLEAIATSRPNDAEMLAAIRGVGPSFIARFATEVLAILAEHRAPPDGPGLRSAA
jgi:ATP-dependent DNA helicase RecQ